MSGAYYYYFFFCTSVVMNVRQKSALIEVDDLKNVIREK